MSEDESRNRDAERDIDRRSPADVAQSLRPVIEGLTLVVGPGQFSPYEGQKRVSVLRVDEVGAPRIVWDRFYATSAIDALRGALAAYAFEVWPGELDTMYATGFSFVWTVPPAPLRVYDREGLVAARRDGDIELFRANTRVRVGDVARFVGWLSADWVSRGVSLELRTGERVVVAETKEWAASVDPTYDGIDVLCDAAWVASLGKALARGIGVEYVAEDQALR